MTNFFQWIGLAIAAGLVGLGVFAFFRGLSLPPNTPEHRAHGKDDTWPICCGWFATSLRSAA
jgi:hypothetical protein